ncbi:3-phosphoshikimate 1-carboxyvinyltransferase [Streptomyces ipomoeae]|uniref:3-phosphoshikimate 1-carboxyvinyltransferase n=1 Tax=Streptomyces ipomoeae TaxID=103232 RepID=UPI001146A7F5|nr:3-phosphoshikimate 1-carboxyvinyltransferase [Streptomyces ipomoeae]MDX2938779.1 3-phosphoshikimate 1-carboxyvinyltransferase [Streptomyces ipomoeae]TQE19693.1 3-phosphoshikimate 1-carboxyvinyltransferase [Streptomyces ipomoeae]
MHLLVKGIRHRVTGDVLVPNSKYHAHRALILASLADGESRVHGLTDARHVEYTVRLLRGLGVGITRDGDTFVVQGLGGRYRPQGETVSAGSSGTTLYFMIGLASLSERAVSITGQKYFRRRPVGPLLRALEQMGVRLESADDCPPVRVQGRRPAGGHVTIPGTLSQWISGVLLLAPFATGPTTIEVQGELNERTYLELTVAMMRQFGLEVTVSPDWRRFDVAPGQSARPLELTLPPDIGSAAFSIATAALHPSDVLLRGITNLSGGPSDHPEFHFLDVARAMGVPMEVDTAAGGVRIQQDAPLLKAVDLDCRDVPDMLPILSVLGTFAHGESVFRNIAHTRLKESDRAAAMLQLNSMGGELELTEDTLRVNGVKSLTGARLSSYNDHRVLMSLSVASSRAHGHSTLTYPNAYRISYPGFLDAMNGIGVPMSVEEGTGRITRPARRRPSSPSEPDTACLSTLPEWLSSHAASRPDATAVVDVRPDGDRLVSWRDLADRVERAAALLLRLGVRPGDNVAYQLPNRMEFVVLSLAALRIGAVCCPVIPFFRQRELGFVLRQSKARVLVVMDEYRSRYPAREALEVAARLEPESGRPRHVVVLSRSDGTAQLPRTAVDGVAVHDWAEALKTTEVDRAALDAVRPMPGMTAQLLFTSGTTGEPKGVTQPSENLVRAACMEIRHLGLDTTDAVWVPSPLAHQTGFLYGMVLATVLGVPQILQAEWDAKIALASLNNHRATFVQAATPFLSDLVKAVEETGEVPRHLEIFVATGATVPRPLAERASLVLGAKVCGAFGTTETCLGALSGPADDPGKRWSTDGRALEGIQLRVTDDAGRVLAPGTEGNFEISSPTVFGGYLNRPDLTAEAFTTDGWYRTGDLAVIDEAGYVRITGRVKDVINRGGEKIPVAEVEQLLFAHPAVDDVAVVAMLDDRLGERACAFTVLRDGARFSFDEMRRYLDQHQVAKQYWPERLEHLGALPRNPVGKVQKFELRAMASGLRPHDEETG